MATITKDLQREVSVTAGDIEALPVLRDSDSKDKASPSSSKKDLADPKAEDDSNTLVQAVRPPIVYDSLGGFVGSVLRFVR